MFLFKPKKLETLKTTIMTLIDGDIYCVGLCKLCYRIDGGMPSSRAGFRGSPVLKHCHSTQTPVLSSHAS